MASSTMRGNEQIFSEAEIEFLAEDEMISIVPNFRGERFEMIAGTYGPFLPQIPVEVPLWLALALKSRQKCKIQVPDWMTVEKLTRTLEEERESPMEFQSLPFHYIEIAELLFEADQQGLDIPEKYKVRPLIKDIRDVRFHKIENGLQKLQGKQQAIKLTNLSAMEVNIVRPFFLQALQSFYRLDNDAANGRMGAPGRG